MTTPEQEATHREILAEEMERVGLRRAASNLRTNKWINPSEKRAAVGALAAMSRVVAEKDWVIEECAKAVKQLGDNAADAFNNRHIPSHSGSVATGTAINFYNRSAAALRAMKSQPASPAPSGEMECAQCDGTGHITSPDVATAPSQERLLWPHEWGYRDPVDRQFIADDAPFQMGEDLAALKLLEEAFIAARTHVIDVSAAVIALASNQRQLDRDGCEVGVSRQAADEVAGTLVTVGTIINNALAALDEGRKK